MKLRVVSFVNYFLFPLVFLSLIFYSKSVFAVNINVICTPNSFCEERPPGSCEPGSLQRLEPMQYVKITNDYVEYWGDVYKVSKFTNSIVEAARTENYPNHQSINESLIMLNRYTGVMELTHTLRSNNNKAEKVEIFQINRIRFECRKAEAKF